MKAMDIKQELRTLIDEEKDLDTLEAIRTLLRKSNSNPVLKEKLTSRALKSEKDIRQGNVYTRSEIQNKLNSSLGA